jgi:hypothetical protein
MAASQYRNDAPDPGHRLFGIHDPARQSQIQAQASTAMPAQATQSLQNVLLLLK